MNKEIMIRQADKQDQNDIVDFFNSNWGKKHNLINDKTFFEYYFTESDDKLRFVLGINKATGEIVGACGYICSNSQEKPTVWTTLWLTKKNLHLNLGLELLEEIKRITNYGIICSNHIAPKTATYYKFLGYKVDQLKHYYRLNDKKNYKVAKIKEKKIIPVSNTGYNLIKMKTIDELRAINISNNILNKDMEYINKRYFKCPFYRYEIYAIDKGKSNDRNSIIVMRKVLVGDVKIIRIVDYIGKDEELAYLGEAIQNLLISEDCEYIDFYCYGINETYLTQAGFNKREVQDNNIIPSYLEPLLQKNVEYMFFTSLSQGFHMFRADGDQDRPNIII